MNTLLKQLSHKLIFKGSALLNAVTVSFIVALFSAALIALWYSNELVILRYQRNIDLIEEHRYTVQMLLANKQLQEEVKEAPLLSNKQGLKSTYSLNKWGLYKVLTVTSRFKNDSISKSYLLGNTFSKNPNRDLYLLDTGRPFKFAGDVSFSQNITIPNSRIESHFLPKVTNKMHRNGKIESSNKTLPMLEIQPNSYELEIGSTRTIEEVLDQGGTLINGFNKETIHLIIPSNYDLRDVVLKGNIMIIANETLKVYPTAILNDVIVKAPEVILLENFSGNMQVVPQRKLTLLDNSTLEYPSTIFAHSSLDSLQVDLKLGARLNGSLIIDSNSNARASQRRLTIEKNAIILGDVYCNGTAEIQGKIYGSSVINRFQYETNTTLVDNLVVDATFDSKKIPIDFVRMPLIVNDIITYHVIKEL